MRMPIVVVGAGALLFMFVIFAVVTQSSYLKKLSFIGTAQDAQHAAAGPATSTSSSTTDLKDLEERIRNLREEIAEEIETGDRVATTKRETVTEPKPAVVISEEVTAEDGDGELDEEITRLRAEVEASRKRADEARQAAEQAAEDQRRAAQEAAEAKKRAAQEAAEAKQRAEEEAAEAKRLAEEEEKRRPPSPSNAPAKPATAKKPAVENPPVVKREELVFSGPQVDQYFLRQSALAEVNPEAPNDLPAGLDGPDPPMNWGRTAVVSLATGSLGRPDYWQGVVHVFQTLRDVGTKIPHLVCIIIDPYTDALPREFFDAMDRIGAHVRRMKSMPFTDHVKTPWFIAWSKLLVFNLTEFEKIIWVDSDTFFVKNIDHLMFEKPFAAPLTPVGCCSNGGEWVTSGGLWVLRPSVERFDQINQLSHRPSIDPFETNKGSNGEWHWGDMQMVRVIFEQIEKTYNKLNASYDVVAGDCDCPHRKVQDDNVFSWHWACVMAKPWHPSFCCNETIALAHIGLIPKQNYKPCVQVLYKKYLSDFDKATLAGDFKDYDYPDYQRYEYPTGIAPHPYEEKVTSVDEYYKKLQDAIDNPPPSPASTVLPSPPSKPKKVDVPSPAPVPVVELTEQEQAQIRLQNSPRNKVLGEKDAAYYAEWKSKLSDYHDTVEIGENGPVSPPSYLSGPSPPIDWSRTAVFTMTTGAYGRPEYWQGPIGLIQSMRNVGTAIPHFIVMLIDPYADFFPPEFEESLDRLGAHVIHIDQMPPSDHVKTAWFFAWHKLRLFNFTQFDKVLWMDSDTMVMRNIDHLLFEPEFTAPTTPSHGCVIENENEITTSGGLWVVHPTAERFAQILDLQSKPSPDRLTAGSSYEGRWHFGDMEMVRVIFDQKEKNWHRLNQSYDYVVGECDCHLRLDHVFDVYSYHWAMVMGKPWQSFFCCNESQAEREFGFAPRSNYRPCVVDLWKFWWELFNAAVSPDAPRYPRYKLPVGEFKRPSKNAEVIAADVEAIKAAKAAKAAKREAADAKLKSQTLPCVKPGNGFCWDRTAIVTMVTPGGTFPNYWQGAIALLQSLRSVGTEVPNLVIMKIRDDKTLPPMFKEAAARVGAIIREIDYLPMGKVNTPWSAAWPKLNVFNLTEYERIIWMDADTMVLRNVDHLMEQPHFSAPETPSSCCVHQPNVFLSGGLWVFEPSQTIMNRILTLSDQQSPDPTDVDSVYNGNWHWGDMEMVRVLFDQQDKSWNHLDRAYDFMVGECKCDYKLEGGLDPYTYHWGCVIGKPWAQGFAQQDPMTNEWTVTQASEPCIIELYKYWRTQYEKAMGTYESPVRAAGDDPASVNIPTLKAWSQSEEGTLKKAAKKPSVSTTSTGTPERWKNTAYVSLATASFGFPEYWQGVVGLFQSLRDTNTQIPHLVAMVVKGYDDAIPDDFYQAMDRLKAEVIKIDPVPRSEHVETPWFMAWNKLYIFNLTQFEKAIWLDSDTMVERNIDFLMDEPEFTAPDTPEGCCSQTGNRFVSGGLWVVHPSHERMKQMMEISSKPSPDEYDLNSMFKGNWHWGDMELVRVVFEQIEHKWNKLNSSFDFCVGECDCPHNMDTTPIFTYHFACVVGKPWQAAFCCDKSIAEREFGFVPQQNYRPCVQELFKKFQDRFERGIGKK